MSKMIATPALPDMLNIGESGDGYDTPRNQYVAIGRAQVRPNMAGLHPFFDK